MKILFYSHDAVSAKEHLAELKRQKQTVRLFQTDAVTEAIPCDEVEFMPDVSEFDRTRLNALFGKEVEPKPGATEGGDKGGSTTTEPKHKIGKGPGGRIYIFDVEGEKKSVYSGPFETEAAAEEALKAIDKTPKPGVAEGGNTRES